MTISKFMKTHIIEIKQIISGLNSKFNAHEFIKEFEARFKQDYSFYLNSYTGNKPMKVNNQIARFLSANETALNITKTRRVSSTNANGNKSSVQEWKRYFQPSIFLMQTASQVYRKTLRNAKFAPDQSRTFQNNDISINILTRWVRLTT